MRFEVEIDDGAGLAALHKAREAYNAENAQVPGFLPAQDMPSFVQRLADRAVAQVLSTVAPVTLNAALAELEQVKAEKAALEAQIAPAQAKPQESKPAEAAG